MACRKCGGSHRTIVTDYPTFTVEDTGEEKVFIGAKASILIGGIAADQVFLRTGKTLKISNVAAADLERQGAPIWIL